MISQNRTDENRTVLAGTAWDSVQCEEKQNDEILDAIHLSTAGGPTAQT